VATTSFMGFFPDVVLVKVAGHLSRVKTYPNCHHGDQSMCHASLPIRCVS
jgi:hypothetical protein